MRSLRFVAALALLSASLVACSDDGVEPRVRAGETRILLTDAPFPYDLVTRVDIHVVSVSGSMSADTIAGEFITLATPNRRINLLELQNGETQQLNSLKLPEGVISAVRMVIDTDKSSITLEDGTVLTGTSSPGISWGPNAGPGKTLNALVHEQIEVPDTGGDVVIDFDVGQSFHLAQDVVGAPTDEGFTFSAVLRATDANRTGSIAGVVRAGTATGVPVEGASLRLYLGNPAEPENTWSTMATARTNASGRFTFAYVTPSAHWAGLPARVDDRYIVAVDPPSGSNRSRMLVPNVTVNAKAETGMGTVVLP